MCSGVQLRGYRRDERGAGVWTGLAFPALRRSRQGPVPRHGLPRGSSGAERAGDVLAGVVSASKDGAGGAGQDCGAGLRGCVPRTAPGGTGDRGPWLLREVK